MIGIDAAIGGDHLRGFGGNDILRGLAGRDNLIGGDDNDVLNGGQGADKLLGGGGSDTATYANAANSVNVDLTRLLGTYAAPASPTDEAAGDLYSSVENVIGSNFADMITGDAAANVLDGGVGIDTVSYLYSSNYISVDLLAGTGSYGDAEGDTLRNVENLTGSYAHANFLYGDDQVNVLTGGFGYDRLQGRGGADQLFGYALNDALFGDAGADLLDGGADFDTARYDSATSAVIGDLLSGGSRGDALGDEYVDMEGLVGGAYGDTLRANAGYNELYGESGNDVLEGRGGGDYLDGGDGLDAASYAGASSSVVVDLLDASLNTGDAFEDFLNGIENLTGSTSADTLRGDSVRNQPVPGSEDYIVVPSPNVLYGLAGNDILDGRAGPDRLYGGLDSDTYTVDDAGDRVFEANVAGVDLVNSSVSFSLLGQYIEKLTLTGSDAIDAIGNALATTFIGNSGANLLDGGLNADRMEGKAGNDTYVVQSTGDAVIEAVASGVDLVNSSISFSLLGKSVENLTLTGAADIGATGSIYANVIRGNAGDNVIMGGLGADDLHSVDGGLDNDRFVYGALNQSGVSAASMDQIFGFDRFTAGEVDRDRIDLSALKLAAAQVKIVDLGTNVNVQINSDTDAAAEMVIQVVGVGTLTSADLIL